MEPDRIIKFPAFGLDMPYILLILFEIIYDCNYFVIKVKIIGRV